ncbi:ABC transporter ATP-binding protein [Spirochaeta cellobiosiphila]|uniref:ABC transporter ATP-binding protein n=1 Tax=Spirochaeta cellobiosiphila TaxID=504483 RepID=UPI00041A0534|nr:ABC transporter ATP-binding protein [Spirochaeta cellobiosiphila]
MKLIITYLKKYWIYALLAPFTMVIEVAMDLLLPTIMAQIVDEGVAKQNINLVFTLGSKMLIVTIISFMGGALAAYFASKASTGVALSLREDLFSKVINLEHKEVDKLESGNIITRLTNDVTQIENTSGMLIRMMVRAPIQVIGSLVLAIMINKRLALLFLIFVPIIICLVTLLLKVAQPLFYKTQNQIDKLNNRIQENLLGQRLIKAFVREDFEKEKFHTVNVELTDISIKAAKTMAFMNPIMQLILNTGIILALWYGAKLVDSNLLKVGSLIAFTNYLRQLLFSLMMLSSVMIRFSRAEASSQRIYEILNTPEKKTEDLPVLEKTKGQFAFKNVSFSYTKQGEPVLKEISFTAEPGQTIAILGATGSGKSTIAKLLLGFYTLDEGSITIDDQDISQINPQSLRELIAYVPQQTTLLSGTIKDNILYHYPEEERESLRPIMQESAQAAKVSDFIDDLPHTYMTDINQRGVNLSGGQKQRVTIARALAKQSSIIIMDDATSAVDTKTENAIKEALKKGQKTKKTTLLIAQKITSVMSADKIIVLDDGSIESIGTHEELLAQSHIYKEIFQSQIDTEVA